MRCGFCVLFLKSASVSHNVCFRGAVIVTCDGGLVND